MRGRVRLASAALLLWTLGLAAVPAAAQAPEPGEGAAGSLGLAFFTPELGFGSALDRTAWYSAVGRALEAQLERPIETKGFARLRDLRAFLSRRGQTLAVVSAPLASSLGGRPLLQARGQGGSAAPPAVLASRQYGSLPELAGKGIIVPDLAGAEKTLLGRLVLLGEASPKDYFGRIELAPDAQGAAAAVSLGKAAATLVYPEVAAAASLATLARVGGMPLPLLIQVGSPLSPELEQRVMAAFSHAPAGGGVLGWGSVKGASAAGPLGGSPSKRPLQPASLPWLPLRDREGGAAAEDDLRLEPSPAEGLFEPGGFDSDLDFRPRGEVTSEGPAAGSGGEGR